MKLLERIARLLAVVLAILKILEKLIEFFKDFT